MRDVLQHLLSAREQWFTSSGEHAQKLLGLGHSVLALEASRSAILPAGFDTTSCTKCVEIPPFLV